MQRTFVLTEDQLETIKTGDCKDLIEDIFKIASLINGTVTSVQGGYFCDNDNSKLYIINYKERGE